jgi:hypothetical protein
VAARGYETIEPWDSAPHSSELTAENARGARVPPRWSRHPCGRFFTGKSRKSSERGLFFLLVFDRIMMEPAAARHRERFG